jgi:pheromone shutdown protein TraB
VHIVGTAHISSESADLAGRLVREAKPDAVFIELDATRLSRAFQGGIPPPGIRIALQDEKGNLQLGVTQKTGLAERLLIKFINAASNPSMYRKLEMSGIPVGEEVSNTRHSLSYMRVV